MTTARLAPACLLLAALGAEPPGPDTPLFDGGVAARIRVEVAPDQLDLLAKEPRRYVRASIREEGGPALDDVALKLKGAAGSFQPWDERPALTLNARKFRKGRAFHGLEKFHLNNSAQDETALNELLASELFRRAGVPAPRVGHARVWLNGRDVGLYVVKEGFDRAFLGRAFDDPAGNLYDGGFLQDLDSDLERDEGAGPDDRADLKAVVEAAREPDPARLPDRLGAVVDLDEFLSFVAVERMIGHWDGYAAKANNYRVYVRRRDGRAVFLPHGMDQVFGDDPAGLFEPASAIVAAPILESDPLRRRYRLRVEALAPLLIPAAPLLRRIDEVERQLAPTIEAMGPDAVADRAARVAALRARLVARAAEILGEIDRPESPPLAFDESGSATPGDWTPEVEREGADLDEVDEPPGSKSLRIAARAAGVEGSPGPDGCIARWRRRVVLGPGAYTLHADLRLDSVVPLDEPGGGVSVGVVGGPSSPAASGSVDRRALAHRFEVVADRKAVDLSLEFRARSGRAWFDAASLRITREGPGPAR